MKSSSALPQANEFWQIKMFGGLEVIGEPDKFVIRQFRTRRSALLLAYLAMKPGTAKSRSHICEMLWPEEDPPIQRNRLRFELSSIRSLFGASPFAGDGGNTTIALSATITSDVATFDQILAHAARNQVADQRIPLLRQALTLYRGDLLPSFDLPDGCPPEYDWLSLERHRYHEAAVDAAIRLMTDLQMMGFHEEANQLRQGLRILLPETEERREEEQKRSRLQAPEPHPPQQVASYAISPPIAFLQGSFYGREAERLWLSQWVQGPRENPGDKAARSLSINSLPPLSETCRLITLLGPGGIGKTRLLVEALIGHTHTIMVPLSGMSDKTSLYDAIATSLRLARRPDSPLRQQVIAALKARPDVILLLDNCEHLLAAVANCINDLMESCPLLRIITTSQHALLVDGEQTLPVLPLLRDEARALFIDRAKNVQSDFASSRADRKAASEVADLLEGIPLAIELAAARAVILSPQQIREQLGRQLNMLASVHPARPVRHRSIRAVFQWSTGLLSNEARRILAFLSLFRTGATLEAVQAVAGEDSSVLDALEELRLYSIVSVQFYSTSGVSEKTRYDVLFHVRQFASELLTQPDLNLGLERHSEFWMRQVASIPNAFHWGQWETIRALLVPDIANIRAAIDGCVQRNLEGMLYRLADALGTVLVEMGYWNEAETLLNQAAHSELLEVKQKVRLLGLQGALYRRRGSEAEAFSAWERNLVLVRSLGDADLEATVLFDLAGQAIELKNFDQARSFIDEGMNAAHRSKFAYRSVVGDVLSARLCMALQKFHEAVVWADISRSALDHIATNLSQELYVFMYLIPIYRRCGDAVRTGEMIRRGLQLAISTGQAFILARFLDEAAPFWQDQRNDTAAEIGYFIAREIHAELGSRFRESSDGLWRAFSPKKMGLEGGNQSFIEDSSNPVDNSHTAWQGLVEPLLRAGT